MAEPRRQFVFLPGLGADARLFDPQTAVFQPAVVPPWIEPQRRESLPDYAARLAETVPRQDDVPLVLVGVSLGGMLAHEMAHHLRPAALFLISTGRSRDALRRHRPLAPAARRLPRGALDLAKWLSPAAVRLFSGWSPELQRLAIDMFRHTDSRFMAWALGAIFDWHSSPPAPVPTLQIHGDRDRAIPVGRSGADRIIAGGGHLINVTHAEEVNGCIASTLEELGL